MSIELTQKVKVLNARMDDLLAQAEALEARLKALENVYTLDKDTQDPPKRRGRPPKYENE